MIGNPVSFPRVKALVDRYEALAGTGSVQVVQVTEQAIIEGMLLANRNGHIACTQGGECLAGLIQARELGLLDRDELAVLDATAHALKFSDFQDMYFRDAFPPEYEIAPREELKNRPESAIGQERKDALAEPEFTREAAMNVVSRLGLEEKS
jgi:threonine synthase